MSTFVNKWKNYSMDENPTDKTDKRPSEKGGQPPFVGFVSSKEETRVDFSPDAALLARAETLITLYGPLRVEGGMSGSALGVIRPETLVGLSRRWPWGVIMSANGVPVMRWGEVP